MAKAGAVTSGLDKLTAVLTARKLTGKRDSNLRLVVGFTAEHAIVVHEDLSAFHAIGQAKYLEQPMRENRAVYARIVRDKMKQGRSLRQAMLAAGYELLRDARALVPVDTGELKASGFVKVVDG